MKVWLFYKGGETFQGNQIFLRNFIEELVLQHVEVHHSEFDKGVEEPRILRYTRTFNRVRKEFPSGFVPDDSSLVLSIIDIRLKKSLIKKIIAHYAGPRTRFLLHDIAGTTLWKPQKLDKLDISAFDGVIVSCESLKNAYSGFFSPENIHVLKSAVNSRLFFPRTTSMCEPRLIFVGNGSKERTDQLKELFINPVKKTRIQGILIGENYPANFVGDLKKAGIDYLGGIEYEAVPYLLSLGAVLLAAQKKSVLERLPSCIPTQLLEGMASGIPTLSTFSGEENLSPGKDYYHVSEGDHVVEVLENLEKDKARTKESIQNALRTVNRGYTCWQRINEFIRFCETLTGQVASAKGAFIVR